MIVGYSMSYKPQTNSPIKSSQSSSSTQDRNQIVNPDAKYVGKENLAKYESIAQKNTNSPTDQVNAAVSAFVNRENDKAAEYYKKAIALQPKNAQYLTYLGNVYFRGLNNPQEAIQYYQTATQDDPHYANGWLNLGLCQIALGNKEGAKATLKKGIASVDPKDPLLGTMQKELDSIK